MDVVKKHKKHKKHKSERKSKYDERPPSLKLILKVNGTPEYGSSDSPYNIHHPEQSSSMLEPSQSEHSEKHKKSKKKKKKKDREKRHKHHKKERHNRRESSVEDTSMMMDDDDSSQLMTESAQLYYSAMTTSSAISSNPVTKPMIPMQEQPKIYTPLQNVPSVEQKPETPLDSPMTPSSIDSATREPRTCVLKLKQSRSSLSKLLDHLLKALEKRDPHQFFAWPVTDDIAPGYSAIITKPMDFSSIRQKIEENEYQLLSDFIGDFRLMCENAIRYNHHETVYNKAARKLLQAGLRILLPEHLTRGPVAVFMKDLSTKELGFDPTIKIEHHDESYSVDSADEGGNATNDQPDPVQEERERREKMKIELDPKTPYEPFVDSLTADEVLEQVQKAARQAKSRLNKKRAHSMGFLRSHTDGTTSMTIIVPTENGVPEKTKKLGDFTGKLQKGTGLLQSFREDRRNIVKLPKALDYGAFSSFAPTFDTRFTNLSKEETELMLNTYGDDNAVNYSTSIQRFTQESHYGNTLANRLLDLLTNGEHSKTMEVLMESEQVKQVQKEVEMIPDYQKESKRLENVNINFDQLKSLRELGLDTSFLTDFERSMRGATGNSVVDLQNKLDTNQSLIEKLHQAQHDRLSTPIQQHLSHVHQPNKQEVELAEQITSNLTSIAKKLPPCAIVSSMGVRKAMGMNVSGVGDDFRKATIGFRADCGSKESLVDTTPMDMELEPPATSTFDHELRELLGTD